jgi:hypothetical protein
MGEMFPVWSVPGLYSYNEDLYFELVESCSCEEWEAGSWGRGQFGNPEEGERQPFEAANKQRLVKTEKTLCVL